MTPQEKESLLDAAKAHVGKVQAAVDAAATHIKTLNKYTEKQIRNMQGGDREVAWNIFNDVEKRTSELAHLRGSPYFYKCLLTLDGEEKTVFISKFSMIEEGISSWTAPIATIRFESPGPISFALPDGTARTGMLSRKENYLIVDGHMVFMAAEAEGLPRTLIHQEHFSTRKDSFVLPEIVERMEKAQDQVIRASHKGAFAVSGPAGSGKTTLALHRIAYLLQSPDTAQIFEGKSTIVFVQDSGTKEYFSELLPELGITDVRIATFPEWALGILGLKEKYATEISPDQREELLYEHAKLTSLRTSPAKYSSNPFIALGTTYSAAFDERQKELLAEQKKRGILDRFDLTILLRAYFERYGKYSIRQKYNTTDGDEIVEKTRILPIEYSLIAVDEFQNYLPEQLGLIRHALAKGRDSMIYVGDMAQQTRLGTLRGWDSLGEDIPEERKIRLHKTYRSTRQILEYIRGQGFEVEIPEGVREGEAVAELAAGTPESETGMIRAALAEDHGIVGIIARDPARQDHFRKAFAVNETVRVLAIHEAQGVEFDTVFLSGFGSRDSASEDLPEELKEEAEKIEKDLRYVALTRAMNRLLVFR